MKYYFDTSSLVKLYHNESGTSVVMKLFESDDIEAMISEITILEFYSTIYKKIRTKEINDKTAQKVLKNFNNDSEYFNIINITTELIYSAKQLIQKYGESGLRTLDSIQFASALKVKNEINEVICCDLGLIKLLKKEFINVLNPEEKIYTGT